MEIAGRGTLHNSTYRDTGAIANRKSIRAIQQKVSIRGETVGFLLNN